MWGGQLVYSQYGDQDEAEEILARFTETPEASSLLRVFVELVLG